MAKLIKNDKDMVDEALIKSLKHGEEVRPVVGYPFYYVTNMGRVFSCKKKINYKMQNGEVYSSIVWLELKQRETSKTNKYLSVNLQNEDGKKVREYVHHLVFRAFNNNYLLDFNVIKIIHKNGYKQDNNYINLDVTWRKKSAYKDHRNYAYKVNRLASLK